MTPRQSIDIFLEPDLSPLYPVVAHLSTQISFHSGLTPVQKAKLVVHCLTRSCVFGDLSVLQFLLTDSQAQAYVDLGIRDEDGIGLISITIHGFGGDSDREVEREECVRFLASQGADMSADKGNVVSGLQLIKTDRVQLASWLDAITPCCTPCAAHPCIVSYDTWLFPFCLDRKGTHPT